MLDRERNSLESDLQRVRRFLPRRNGLLEAVLRERRRWALEGIFRLLGLLYEPERIYHAYRALFAGDRSRVEAGLELLDTILSLRHRERLLP